MPRSIPSTFPAVRHLHGLEFHPDVTFLVGENGSGKSTLLEAIAIALGFGAEGGTRNVRFKTAETVSSLHNHLRLVKSFRAPKDHYFLRAESFYNVQRTWTRPDTSTATVESHYISGRTGSPS